MVSIAALFSTSLKPALSQSNTYTHSPLPQNAIVKMWNFSANFISALLRWRVERKVARAYYKWLASRRNSDSPAVKKTDGEPSSPPETEPSPSLHRADAALRQR